MARDDERRCPPRPRRSAQAFRLVDDPGRDRRRASRSVALCPPATCRFDPRLPHHRVPDRDRGDHVRGDRRRAGRLWDGFGPRTPLGPAGDADGRLELAVRRARHAGLRGDQPRRPDDPRGFRARRSAARDRNADPLDLAAPQLRFRRRGAAVDPLGVLRQGRAGDVPGTASPARLERSLSLYGVGSGVGARLCRIVVVAAGDAPAAALVRRFTHRGRGVRGDAADRRGLRLDRLGLVPSETDRVVGDGDQRDRGRGVNRLDVARDPAGRVVSRSRLPGKTDRTAAHIR